MKGFIMQFSPYFSLISLITLAGISSIANGMQNFPLLIIKKVTNNTATDIVLLDRNNSNKPIAIPAQQSIDTSLNATTKNVIISGDMGTCMAQQAQYEVQPINSKNDQGVYIHMNLFPGGVNDGSGIIVGDEGSLVLKFLLAGKKGGMQMQSRPLKKSDAKSVEVALILSMSRFASKERFALEAQYTTEEK